MSSPLSVRSSCAHAVIFPHKPRHEICEHSLISPVIVDASGTNDSEGLAAHSYHLGLNSETLEHETCDGDGVRCLTVLIIIE
jgi:hypothetical protein